MNAKHKINDINDYYSADEEDDLNSTNESDSDSSSESDSDIDENNDDDEGNKISKKKEIDLAKKELEEIEEDDEISDTSSFSDFSEDHNSDSDDELMGGNKKKINKKKTSSGKTDESLTLPVNVNVNVFNEQYISEIESDSSYEDESDDDSEDENINYMQKLDKINKNELLLQHPESRLLNCDEIQKLCVVVRDENGIIIDPLHKTLPILTKYEKTRILGQRSKQIETGAKLFITDLPSDIIEPMRIAEIELNQKKIPFIIERPIPSGAFEYWKITDLEDLNNE